MRTRRLPPPALTLAGCLLLCGEAAGQGAPLFEIPLEVAAPAPVAADEALRLALYSRDLPRLAAVLGVPVPESGDGRLDYLVAAYPQLPSGADRTWLESSFVIDFRAPDVLRLRDEMLGALGARPSRPQLVSFVASAVSGTHGRGWDLASTVARRREGDCTEFAVLTAALARALDMPARVALGMVVVSEGPTHRAYGHAWTELLEEGRWVIADAALHGAAARISYVPQGVLANEGPGYALDLARLLMVWVDRVVVLGSPPSTR